MKTTLTILTTALVAMFFSSCSHQAIYYDANGNIVDSSSSLNSITKHDALSIRAKRPKKPRLSISPKVLSRATMQGSNGAPHLGLIPTMKTLAPDL